MPSLCAAVSCHSALAEEAVTKYVPGPVTVGPEIWAGAIAATIPFVIGSWEFAKRIVRPQIFPVTCHWMAKLYMLLCRYLTSKMCSGAPYYA